jgi:nitrogen fixation NifU-like protein
MLTQAIMGLSLEEVEALFESFKGMMYGSDQVDPESLGDLEALQGVRKFPVRVKCATLAWNVLQEALEQYGKAKT